MTTEPGEHDSDNDQDFEAHDKIWMVIFHFKTYEVTRYQSTDRDPGLGSPRLWSYTGFRNFVKLTNGKFQLLNVGKVVVNTDKLFFISIDEVK